MISVVLADDHAILREGVRMVLEAEPDVRVLAEVSEGESVVLTLVETRPDVLLLDLELPILGGLEVLRRVRQAGLGTRVIILSMHRGENYVLPAIRAGADGYLLKGVGAAELRHAVRRVAAGERYLCQVISTMVIEAYAQATKATDTDLYDALTPREREVLKWAAEGHTSATIAKRLAISPRTVEAHRANILRKLVIHTQTDLVRFALSRHLIEGIPPHEN